MSADVAEATPVPPHADPATADSATTAPAPSRAQRWTRGWRGPLLAALVVLAGALPGLLRLPPLDRDESRFAQATAQMLETGDFVDIRYQDAPRDKKPVGIHWLQALSVSLVSSVERREIWAYRLPSLLGAMVAAAACCWGARPFFGPGRGAAAGAILGAAFLLSTEAGIAKTDAVLCGAVTLAMAALGRIYGAARGVGRAGAATRLLLWLGLAVSVLDKGPIGPMVAGLALLTLWALDRGARWMRGLGWGWGAIVLLAVVGPWTVAITVATDGGFWGKAVGGDLAPKLAGGHESHGAPPGLHALLSPLLLFPASFLLPAALSLGWRERLSPGVRFAVAWLVPAWIVFELTPTKLVHYTLPLYGALAWLAAAAISAPIGRLSVRLGAALSLVAGMAFAGMAGATVPIYGGEAGWAILGGALALAAGAAGAVALLRRRPGVGLIAAGTLGVAAHAAIAGGLAPTLSPLWESQRAAALLERRHLDPRNGLTPGPVAVAGFAEPSLVFLLGTSTDLGDGAEAADAIANGQPALVERRDDAAFRAALLKGGTVAVSAGHVAGVNYSRGKPVELMLWRNRDPPHPAALWEAPP